MRKLRFLVFLGLATQVLAVADSPVYTIGSVPSQSVFRGTTLSFQLQAARPGTATFSYSVNPGYQVPRGAIALDSSSGLFSYTPSAEDKFDFWLTFSSSSPDSSQDSQPVHFTLPPETDLIQPSLAIPDPASTDYLLVTQSQNPSLETFNGISRMTWNVEISGKTVVFDGSTPNYGGLYTRFHNRPDMKNMSIYAETLIVRNPVKFPGANLTVHARHVRFEDTSDMASLDTTPMSYAAPPGQFQNGADGQKAGDITLNVQDFFAQPGSTVRLIARGGAGQDPGVGRNGLQKSPLNKDKQLRWGDGVGRTVYDRCNNGSEHACWGSVVDQNGQLFPRLDTYPWVVYVEAVPSNCGSIGFSQKALPEDGENAIPAGVPGKGGNGGQINATLSTIQPVSQAPAGSPGSPRQTYAGGPPQDPSYAVELKSISGTRCTKDYFNFQVTGIKIAVPGKDAASPQNSAGAAGAFTLIPGGAVSWLHPYFLRAVLAHAKDAYRVGNLSYAQSVLQDYDHILSNSGAFPSDFDQQLQQTQSDIEGLLYRTANNMDYFGNKAGWVPLLSLEATMSAFQGEVDAAVPVLFLSQWLQAKSDQNQKDVAALQDAISKAKSEATAAANDLSLALQAIPKLQYDVSQLNTQVQSLQNDLQQREDALIEQAKKNVEDANKVEPWKKALRVIGTVAELVPVYQPALAAIGKGLIYVTTIDTKHPLDSLKNIPDLSAVFAEGAWKDNSIFRDFTDALPYTFNSISDAKDTINVFNRFKDMYQAHKEDVQQTIEILKNTQISDADVRKELDKLESQDSVLNDLIAQVASVQTKKQAFEEELAKTQQAITSDSTIISNDLESIASMYQNVNSTASQFDHAVVGYVKDMERRARERLLRYQYYMARAYEYRMLKTYPGDLNVDSVVKQIQTIIGTDGYQITPAHMDYLKSVYLDSVRQIVFLALNELQNTPPERSLPFYFNLTSSELQQLNQTGQLTLDLAPRIVGLPNEDNRHIADLAINNVSLNMAGPLGPVARVRFVLNHRGESTETSAGRSYKFHFGNGPNDQPFTWGASYTLPNGPLSQESLSVAGLSLLQKLLIVPGQTSVDPTALSMFARPGADAVVDMTMVRDPATLNAPVTNLQVAVTVDFFRTRSPLARLSVQTSNGSLPYITLDRTDVTGRADGLGTFRRTFNVGDRVALTAEPTYGSSKFVSWVDDGGGVLTSSNSLPLTLAGSRVVQAIYTPIAPPQYAISGTVADGAGSGVPDVTLQLSGDKAETTVTGADGSYQFTGLTAGGYRVTPTKTGYTFTPSSQSFTTISSNQTANFTAQSSSGSQYSISGKVTDTNSAGVAGVTIVQSGLYCVQFVGGPSCAPVITASDGSYQFTGLPPGTYTITPSKTNYTFTPPTASVAIFGANQTANFTAVGVTSGFPQLLVANGSGSPGGSVDLPIRLVSAGTSVAAMQWELDYDPTYLTYISSKASGPLTNAAKSLTIASSTGKLLAIGAGLNQTTIADGQAAVFTFGLSSSFPVGGKTTVSCTNVKLVDPTGTTLASTGGAGTVTAASCSCDLNKDGAVNIADVQLMVNQVLGITSATCDLNGDGRVDIADVQVVVNAVLGLGCNR